mgnify:CR=1 FL=1
MNSSEINELIQKRMNLMQTINRSRDAERTAASLAKQFGDRPLTAREAAFVKRAMGGITVLTVEAIAELEQQAETLLSQIQAIK